MKVRRAGTTGWLRYCVGARERREEIRCYLREHRPDYFSATRMTLSCQAAHEQDVYDWFVDQGWYHLPDGTLVRAVLVERDDECSWLIKDRHGQNLYRFREDGRVQAYVQIRIPYYSDTKRRMDSYISIRFVPCDLMIDDLVPA